MTVGELIEKLQECDPDAAVSIDDQHHCDWNPSAPPSYRWLAELRREGVQVLEDGHVHLGPKTVAHRPNTRFGTICQCRKRTPRRQDRRQKSCLGLA